MPRKYEKVQSLMPEIKKMAEQGFTQREIAQELGLSDKRVVKEASLLPIRSSRCSSASTVSEAPVVKECTSESVLL